MGRRRNLGVLHRMKKPEARRLFGMRMILAVGAILLVIGCILLDIVSDPPRAAYAFQLGVSTAAVGCVSVLAGLEAAWLSAEDITGATRTARADGRHRNEQSLFRVLFLHGRTYLP